MSEFDFGIKYRVKDTIPGNRKKLKNDPERL
jgi:hypothetical protein